MGYSPAPDSSPGALFVWRSTS